MGVAFEKLPRILGGMGKDACPWSFLRGRHGHEYMPMPPRARGIEHARLVFPLRLALVPSRRSRPRGRPLGVPRPMPRRLRLGAAELRPPCLRVLRLGVRPRPPR